MSFDFQIHIGPADQATIERIAEKDRVSTQEVAERIFREGLKLVAELSPGEQMWGAFSSPQDVELTDRAVEQIRELRQADRLRDLGA
jgi:hypothetical protein